MLRALVLKHLHNHASGASDILHVRVTPHLFFLLLINNIIFFLICLKSTLVQLGFPKL